MRTKLFVLILSGAALLTARLDAGPVLFGVTQTGSLFTVDPTNASVTSVGTIAGTLALTGLAVSNNHLYAYDANANNLLEISIDPAQHGAILNTFNLGISAIGEGDIAFDAGSGNFNGSGILYIASAAFPTVKFYSDTLTNATTGSSTLLKTCAVSPCPSGETRVFFDGLSFVGNTLYGLQQGGAGLYTINTANGFPTLAGSTSLAGGNANGALTTRASDNELFGDLSNNVGATLYTFAADGTPTAVGTLGSMTNVTGLAFVNEPDQLPEPSTITLFACGLGFIAWRLRSRRSSKSSL